MSAYTERRRVVLALAVTLLAVPILLLSGKKSSGDDSGAGAAVVSTSAAPDQPLDPAFLPSNERTTVPQVITVNVPAAESGTHIKGDASFVRWQSDLTRGLRVCATPHAKIGTEITVTNLNNGRSLKCTNGTTESRGSLVIIIDADVFAEIADLVDAPIPVEISF